MRPLIDLIRAVPEALSYPAGAQSISVSGITSDSRLVRRGSLFAALKGAQQDGTRFIDDAKYAGAAAILCDKDAEIRENGAPLIRSENPRKALAHIAAAYYARQPEHIVAITGTDGKTSTADFYRQFWAAMGKKSGSIGTLGVLLGDGETLHSGSHTTPDPIELHKILAEMAGLHVSYVAMEASSHGIDQCRLDGVKLQAAAFTNLGRDHLDYHKTEEAYFSAKARLFDTLLSEGATAVLNQDDTRFPTLKAIAAKRKLQVIGFGKRGSEFRIGRIEPHGQGQTADLKLNGRLYSVEIPMVGAFQVMNILAALGLVVATGGELEPALDAIADFKGVPGRLELAVRLANGATVYIDYAHTPLALANILSTLRPHTKHKLHVVFGCGGDRDPGKRPEMGKIAAELADKVIVTDDNPRSENPSLIRKAILAECAGAKEVADRREAIYVALKRLGPGDILVIAGKGHEKTQITGTKAVAFDDLEVARQGAKELQLAA